MKAPVIVFVYSRAEMTAETLKMLNRCHLAGETDLYIFADNAKKPEQQPKVEAVRAVVREFAKNNAFASVTVDEAPQNRGLAASVVRGVSAVMEKHGRVIVVEDDILVTENFLDYMNDTLDYYQNDARVWSISGNIFSLKELENYPHDVFFTHRGDSWGWATWADRWNTVDWQVSDYAQFRATPALRKQFARGGADLPAMLDAQMEGRVDSWAVRWCYAESRQDKFTVYPRRTFTLNIGMEDGTHCIDGKNQGEEKDLVSPQYQLEPFFEDEAIARACQKHYAKDCPGFVHRVAHKLKKCIGIMK